MIEVLVILLIVIIIGCFGVQLFLSQPQIEPLLQGMFVPKVILLHNQSSLHHFFFKFHSTDFFFFLFFSLSF